jgi:hypothetical protein
VQFKTIGEGENIREFLTARAAYPGLVTKLDAIVSKDPTLAGTTALATIVTNEKDLVAALRLDATAAENTVVASGIDAAATKREQLRSHFYDDFWIHYTQLDELVSFLDTNGSTQMTQLATKLTAWQP